MAINLNGTNIENVIFNGNQLDKVIFDGTLVWENININYVQECDIGTIVANQKIKGVLICSAYNNTKTGGADDSTRKCNIAVSSYTGSKCEELSSDIWNASKWVDGAGNYWGGNGNLRIYSIECDEGDTFTIESSHSGSATLIHCGKSTAEVVPYDNGAQMDFKHGIAIGVGHRGDGSTAVNITMSNGTCDSYEEISSTANGTGKRLIAKVSGQTGDTINFEVTKEDYANGMLKLINIL